MRRLAKPVSPLLGSEGSNPSLSAIGSTRAATNGKLHAETSLETSKGFRNDLQWRSASAAVVLAALIHSGCAAKRELVVLSDPPGATVRLDDAIVGKTPYRMEFESFGKRRVTLYHEGCRTWSDLVDLQAPWYGRFPFDFFSEVLVPVGWKYRKEVPVTLEPATGDVSEPDLEPVLRRAEMLRKAGPEGPRPVARPTAQPQ